ncbi:MAG: ribosome biogenesis factor YjgA [Parahaliea sp.]
MVDNDDFDYAGEAPSKSAVKRQMLALQALGERLTQLSDRELGKIPLSDARLTQAIVETRGINSNSARRRHLQFIGKLMRDVDPEPVQAALDNLHREQRASADRFHQLEQLRDELLAKGQEAIEPVLARWPQADRQQLRQLLLQHQREQERGKAPAAARKLFRYLRELQEHSAD